VEATFLPENVVGSTRELDVVSIYWGSCVAWKVT